MEYSEEDAIKHIKSKFEKDIDSDEILNVLDAMMDFYDENGYNDISIDIDDEDADTEELLKYVKKMIAKDKQSPLTPEDVETIVMAEIEYEDSLDI